MINGPVYTFDDKPRISYGASWLTSLFSRSNGPTTPLTNAWSNDEKYTWREPGSHSLISLSPWRTYLRRYWPSSNVYSPSISPPRNALSVLQTSNPPVKVSAIWFVLQCTLWYTTSALSSNTGKAIMTQFRYPITLTFIQFGFVALYCLLFMSPLVRFSTLRMPSRAILRSTLPMGMFQVGGHIASSMAISRIPVSTVHTIKALSPLFTVAAYALLFRVSYSAKTYISLLPLTIGVMLACSFDMSASNAIGLFCAFASAIVFVSSNIFFKKIMPSTTNGLTQASSHKLDKLNLLFYSSSMAFMLMIPIWLYSDLPRLLAFQNDPDHVSHPTHGHPTSHSVTYYFFMNGTVHFAQNIIAFIILSSTSPVTYSIASLIKRVAVIFIAIVWFNQSVHPIQAAGIGMTFIGLYMYNNAKSDVAKGENKMRRVEVARTLALPSNKVDIMMMSGMETPPEFLELSISETTGTGLASALPSATAYERPNALSSAFPHPPQSHNQFPHQHSHPYSHSIAPPLNLTILTPSSLKGKYLSKEGRANTSPTEPYPSPPPSVDSPPSSPGPLGHVRMNIPDIHLSQTF